jgi:dTDP-4-amino-4,6-dideoxygalactose transaminase
MSAAPPGVPLVDLQAQYRPIRDEILAALTRVCDSQRFIMGPDLDALERELAQLLAVEHAVAVSSGTDALSLALMTLGVGAGDEVITPAYSFFATAGVVVRLGAKPVFVDVDPDTFNLDPDRLAAAVTTRTKAVIPVHLFGLSADLDPILSVASDAGVPVVEDAAQAIGATYRSRPVGGFGSFGCFSFFPSKNLGAFGDAGLLTTNDASLAQRARLLRTHGEAPQYYHHLVGANFRMDTIQAAILRVKLTRLADWTAGRRRNADRYREMFQKAGCGPLVRLPVEPPNRRHIYNQFVIRTTERDALKRRLDERRIGNQIYYPLPFHQQPCFASLGYREGVFPHSERAARESLALPIYAELTADQQRLVVSAVAEFFHDRGLLEAAPSSAVSPPAPSPPSPSSGASS